MFTTFFFSPEPLIEQYFTKYWESYSDEKKTQTIKELPQADQIHVIFERLKSIEKKISISAPVTQREFVNYAIKIFKDTHHGYTCGYLEQLKILANTTREKIQGDLGKLVKLAENIIITKEVLIDWKEIVLWLRSMHRVQLDKVANDMEDEILTNWTGVSKAYVTSYYWDLANQIEVGIKKCGVALLPMSPVREQTSEEKSLPEKSAAENVVTAAFIDEVIEATIATVVNDGSVFTDSEEKMLESTKANIKKIVSSTKYACLLDYLEPLKNLQQIVKFNMLVMIPEYLELNEAQINAFLSHHKQTIDAQLTAYLNKNYLFKACHHQQVSDAKKIIMSSDNPREIILELHKLWSLSQKDNSKHLLPKIIELLNASYDLLCLHANDKQMTMSPSK